MPKTATIHARLDEQTKNDALAVFDALGISLSEAITLYFRQVALKNGIPFELTTAINPKNNLERVHEYRRKDLQEILQMLPSSVDELWVFGSSVTPYCRPNSDLDILVDRFDYRKVPVKDLPEDLLSLGGQRSLGGDPQRAAKTKRVGVTAPLVKIAVVDEILAGES